MLTVGGVIAMLLGSLMLFESPAPYLRLSRVVIFATVSVCAVFFSLVLWFVVRTQRTRYVSGLEGMVGERGVADTDIHPEGRVFVHGEYWDAFSAEPINKGERIEVVRVVENLRLEVKKVEGRHQESGFKDQEKPEA
jgi:membrane-bound serine protease (ClpP class)